ncbi:hypothetical protein [Tautonia plasticadhaerens]|uniref:Uncharacterized protein n=1 Tax=Tautonia plasticadhaerens TaxID=2527974 RepID=A0A518HFK5_9BACT|nr:hypothetical protein [Tautonia plasticadhaerens]QDV39632.1 hypothetical protein ElP_76040 [Tautonia plasticadhaerens]
MGFVADNLNDNAGGIGAGEESGILFTLQSGKTYADVVAALAQGRHRQP